jgi:preprotein translocase subunit SecE
MATAARRFQPLQTAVAYVRGSVDELRKVVWPTREQTIQYTLIVVVSVLVVIALTAALDYGLSKLFEQILEWSGSK